MPTVKDGSTFPIDPIHRYGCCVYLTLHSIIQAWCYIYTHKTKDSQVCLWLIVKLSELTNPPFNDFKVLTGLNKTSLWTEKSQLNIGKPPIFVNQIGNQHGHQQQIHCIIWLFFFSYGDKKIPEYHIEQDVISFPFPFRKHVNCFDVMIPKRNFSMPKNKSKLMDNVWNGLVI